MQPRTADFYVPDIFVDVQGLTGQTSHASAAWPTANKAIYIPVIFRYPATLTSITYVAGNGTGNYDLGLYDGYSKLKLASSGSTAVTAAGGKTLTFTTPIRVEAGWLYYAAVAVSSTSGAAFKGAPTVNTAITCGLAEQTTALPLPATMAPATISSAYMPIIIFGVR